MSDRDSDRKHYDNYDDDYDYMKRRHRDSEPRKGTIERILTPGNTANNVIKTAATGIIAGGTILLMGIYGLFGENLAGASFLPMATAVSSAVGTACIWIFGRPKTEEAHNEEFSILRKEIRSLNSELKELQTHHNELEGRLANVELLESFEDKLAKHTLDKEAQARTSHKKATKSSPISISSNMPSSSGDTENYTSSTQTEIQ